MISKQPLNFLLRHIRQATQTSRPTIPKTDVHNQLPYPAAENTAGRVLLHPLRAAYIVRRFRLKRAALANLDPERKGIEMNMPKSLKMIVPSMLMVIGLAACDKPGPAETAGKNIDRTVDQAGQKIGEAADKVGEKISEQSAKAGVAIDDAEITTKVKAAILAEPGLKTLQISVDTVKGVVTLSGSVDTQAHSDTAKSLARAVSGVSAVNNQLLIKPGKPH